MNNSRVTPLLLLFLAVIALSSCRSYQQNVMFRVTEGANLKEELKEAERNYVISENDFVNIRVYTNYGERLIDPDFKLMEDISVSSNTASIRPVINFLVDVKGFVKLPMIDSIKLVGLTLRQAELILQKEYSKFYEKPFVILEYQNKRVVVLGAPGGQVIPLANQNVRLVEILALAKGVDNNSKAHNIRVLRGDQIFVADFSTFEKYTKSNIVMEPGDVVYVEPVRRPIAESVRDYGPLIAVVSSLTTLAIVLIGL